MKRIATISAFVMSLGVVGACGDDDSDADDGDGAGASSGATAGGGADQGGSGAAGDGNGSGGSGNSSSGTGGGTWGHCDPIPLDDTGCTGQVFAGENIPLDLYIMFDSSGSMGTQATPTSPTRLAMVRMAALSFLEDPASSGIGTGIGYFGYQEIGETTCDPADYATPAVPMGVLPTNATAMAESLESITNVGETPTGAAIRGACSYAQGWKQDHLGHAVVILLVTDGEPKAPVTSANGGCDPTIEDAVTAAGDCLGTTPAVPTYVLGVGPLLENLNQIAVAGGTDSAYLVEEESSAAILEAFNAIRGAATVPCEMQIPPPPPGELLDYSQVNLVIMNAACEQLTIRNVADAASCDPETGGWYYDNPSAPNTILLCGGTCDEVSVPGAQLLFSIGCATIVT